LFLFLPIVYSHVVERRAPPWCVFRTAAAAPLPLDETTNEELTMILMTTTVGLVRKRRSPSSVPRWL